MTGNPPPARLIQVEETLKIRFFPITPPIAAQWDAGQHERNRLSRSLAAFAIGKLAGLSDAEAANAVIDGGDDNGIDAIHFDRLANTLYVGQAKAGAAPDHGDNKKFCDGVRDLVRSNFHKFNEAFERLQPDVEAALQSPGVKICGFVTYLSGNLSGHVVGDLDALKAELNQFQERFDWKDCGLAQVHGWLTEENVEVNLDVTLTLESWNGRLDPHRVFYGTVRALELADLYEVHGKAMFAKNIRHYMGDVSVNVAIKTSALENPADLLLLNNGLTIVCREAQLPPGYDNSRADFHLKAFSVVNGAQTVGALASAKAQAGTIPAEAMVQATIIVIPQVEPLGPRITRCRNTQNAIRMLHFVALDPNQERLRQEMAISGVTYHYRPSAEAAVENETNLGVERATLALAAFSGKTDVIVAAKREVGQLFDQEGPFYGTLVRDALSGAALIRLTRVYSYLDGIMAGSEAAEDVSLRRAFYRHGRLFTMHILARRHRMLLDKAEVILSNDDKLELSRVLTDLAEIIYAEAAALFRGETGYLAIFRSQGNSVELARKVMDKLAQLDAAAAAARGGQ